MHRNEGLEIVYLSRGHLLWQTEGRVESVPRGSVFFTLPGKEHGSVEEFEPGHEWFYVILEPGRGRGGLLPPGLGLASATVRRLESALRRSKRHAFPATERLSWLLPQLVREMEQPGSHHKEAVVAMLRAVLVELMRSLEGATDQPMRVGVNELGGDLRRLIDEIVQSPEKQRTLASMSAACSLGRTRFAERFVALTGDTPMRFVNRMRVRKACGLLRSTDWPVTRIAMECGFESSQYFAAVFKKITGGHSASDYRGRWAVN